MVSLEVLIGTEERDVFKAAVDKRRMDAREAKKAPRVYDTSSEIENVTTVNRFPGGSCRPSGAIIPSI